MPDTKEETEILVQGDDELLEATDLPDKDEPTEEVEVSIDAEDLKPKPAEKRAPRGIETFTVCRQNDEGGISGTGVVIEGVLFATGQVVLHWLSPSPLGSISIFASMDDFKKIHAAPHKDNKTIITWSDGRQDSW
jgi:hypothetical protein